MRTVLWRERRSGNLDRCVLAQAESGDGYRLSGTALVLHEGAPFEVRYGIVIDGAWRTVTVGVHVQTPHGDRRLALVAGPDAAWSAGRQPLPEVAGCLDVDLAVTPASNTLPIRRLALPVGAAADVAVAHVDFPDLSVTRSEQRYERLAAGHYRFSAGEFTAVLGVDGDGLVTDYEGAWEAIAGA